MKVKLIFFAMVGFLGLGLLLAPSVGAADCSDDDLTAKQHTLCAVEATNPGVTGQSSEAQVNHVLKTVIHVLGIVVGVASIIVILVQGLRLVVSSGSGESVKSARSGIIYAVVGLIVAILAQSVAFFVVGQL